MFDNKGIAERYFSLFPHKNQIELAEKFKVTPTTVSEWAKGKKQIPWRRLEAATNDFNVSWDWLLLGKKTQVGQNTPLSGDLIDYMAINRDFQRILSGYELAAVQGFISEDDFADIIESSLNAAKDVILKRGLDGVDKLLG